jgi:hypothetical protein
VTTTTESTSSSRSVEAQGVDPLAVVDAHNEAREREIDYEFGQKVGDIGEKLAFAFGQDNLTHRIRMSPLSVKLKKRRALQNYEIR